MFKIFPNSIHQNSFKMYNSDWRHEDILVFEHILYAVRRSGKIKLDLSKEKVEKETRLSRRYVRNAFEKLQRKGILHLEPNSLNSYGMKYWFNIKTIVENIDLVYDFSSLADDPNEIEFYKEYIIDWYKNELGHKVYWKLEPWDGSLVVLDGDDPEDSEPIPSFIDEE